MRIKLLIILGLILGYTYPSIAQDYSSYGRSIYSSKISTYKSYQKTKLPEGTKQMNKLEETATSTSTYTYTLLQKRRLPRIGTATDSITTGESVIGTYTFRPWLGESLYRRQLYHKKEQEHKEHNYPSFEKERGSEDYSNIFYKEKGKKQPDLEEERLNPFLKK